MKKQFTENHFILLEKIKNYNTLEEDVKREIGYISRTLVQTSLPYKKPETNSFKRENGNFTLILTTHPSIGLPYGSIPRIILAWITTESVKTKNKHIYLGKRLSEFLEKIGFERRGGERGDIMRVKTHITKLLCTQITLQYSTEKEGKKIELFKNIQAISQSISKSNSLLVTHEGIKESIWQTEIILNQEFFDEIISKPVPIDFNVLKSLRNSPLAIDIYCWATYRCFSLKNDVFITWDKLRLQFGIGYSDNKTGKYEFKRSFIKQLEKVCWFYNELNVKIEKEGILLKKSSTHINSIS